MNTLKLHKYFWSEIQPEINIGNYVNLHMNLNEFKEDDSYFFLTQKFLYREIVVLEIYKNYSKQADSILGIGLPSNVVIPHLKPNIIQRPQNEIGLIHLPRNNDFIILTKSYFNKLSILEQSLNEMRDISAGTMSPRAGAAGGLMLSTSKSRSLSMVTQNDTVMCVRKQSTAMSVTYRNKVGQVKGRNAVYKDLFMTRYCSNKKFKLMIKSEALQRLSIMEMISRLRSFMLLDFKKIIPIEISLKGFKDMTMKRKEMEHKFVMAGRTHDEVSTQTISR